MRKFWGAYEKFDFVKWDKSAIEKVHLRYCNSYLGINRKSSNLAARSELGRFPIKTVIDQKILNYFIHLNSLDDNSLCKQALNLSYNLSVNHKTSFYSSIQTLLTEYNLPLEIIRQNRISINQSQNIKNKYIEFWQDKLLLSNKLSFYSNIKKSYCIESYLELKNVNQKKNITKLRTSSHNLMIEKGRYLNLNREERLCPFCPNKIIEVTGFVPRL